jgi:hypothetical protein
MPVNEHPTPEEGSSDFAQSPYFFRDLTDQPAPPPAKARRAGWARGRSLAVTAALVIGAGVGATAVASAATGHSSPAGPVAHTVAAGATTSTSTAGSGSTTTTPAKPGLGPWGGRGPGPAGFGGRRGGGFGPGPLGGFGMVAGRALHGQVTYETKTGSYATVDFQRGSVEAASATSIEVKSADGFSQTYAINSGTKVLGASSASAIKSTDTVMLDTTAGSSTVAGTVVDITQAQANRPKGLARPPWAKGGSTTTTVPGSSTTTTGKPAST